jgi:aspartate 1-decarboxylase
MALEKENMRIEVLKSKIHRVKISQAELLMEAADIVENEKVQVVNINNGERLDTYVIKGERNSAEVCLNGPAARKAQVGDDVIIITYASIDKTDAISHSPILVFANDNNLLTA